MKISNSRSEQTVSQTSSIHCGYLNHKGRVIVLREPILIPAESFKILRFILFEDDWLHEESGTSNGVHT